MKFANWEENNVGKGEMACYEQFLLFPLCLSKDFLLEIHKNQGLFGKGSKVFRFK